jgi:hypothetical protein
VYLHVKTPKQETLAPCQIFHSTNATYLDTLLHFSKMDVRWRLIVFILNYALVANGNFLIPGIMNEKVELTPNSQEYVGFLQSALNGTEVEVRLRCDSEVNVDFEVRFVVRSSPCAKEFFVDKSRFNQVTNLLVSFWK